MFRKNIHFSWFRSEKGHVWEEVSYHRLAEGGASVKRCENNRRRRRQIWERSRDCLYHPPTDRAGVRAEPEENGVHFRGLLLYAGSAAHSGAYFLRYLARKYTPRRH